MHVLVVELGRLSSLSVQQVCPVLCAMMMVTGRCVKECQVTSVGTQADSPSIMRFTLTDQVYPLSQAQSTTAGPHLPFSTCKITERSISYKCTEALRLLCCVFNA